MSETINDHRKKCIEDLISQKKKEINDVDGFFGDAMGVSQALGQLREVLNKVDVCLDRREFEKAS